MGFRSSFWSDHQAGGQLDGNRYVPWCPRESAGSSASLENTPEKCQVGNSLTHSPRNWWLLQTMGTQGQPREWGAEWKSKSQNVAFWGFAIGSGHSFTCWAWSRWRKQQLSKQPLFKDTSSSKICSSVTWKILTLVRKTSCHQQFY